MCSVPARCANRESRRSARAARGAWSIAGPSAPVANKSVTNNFLAGGSYTIYAGAPSGSPTSKIVITGNRFGQHYYAKSGQYGPVVYFGAGTGNTWSGNTWDTTGQAISAP